MTRRRSAIILLSVLLLGLLTVLWRPLWNVAAFETYEQFWEFELPAPGVYRKTWTPRGWTSWFREEESRAILLYCYGTSLTLVVSERGSPSWETWYDEDGAIEHQQEGDIEAWSNPPWPHTPPLSKEEALDFLFDAKVAVEGAAERGELVLPDWWERTTSGATNE